MMRLVIPLDDSLFSRSVLPYVERTFPPGQWGLALLRVAQPPAVRRVPAAAGAAGLPGGGLHMAAPSSPSAPLGGFPSQRVEGERERLESRLQRDASTMRAKGYEVAVEVRFGAAPVAEIARFVREEEADAVAMATHGRTALGRLVRGSVAEGLLHRVGVPLFLVRGSGRGAAPPAQPSSRDTAASGKGA